MREDICDTYSSQRVVTKNMLKKKKKTSNKSIIKRMNQLKK